MACYCGRQGLKIGYFFFFFWIVIGNYSITRGGDRRKRHTVDKSGLGMPDMQEFDLQYPIRNRQITC